MGRPRSTPDFQPGDVVGRLTILGETTRPGSRGFAAIWHPCQCSCGGKTEVSKAALRRNTLSCGCLRQRLLDTGMQLRHGQTKTRAYRSWGTMLQRCYNPKNLKYPSYGGRGIVVCDRWLNFDAFLADMGQPPVGATLDRRDNSGPYELSNCRWATATEQARNRRSNKLISFRNETRCLAEWGDVLGFKPATLLTRLDRLGWSIEKAFTTPLLAYGEKTV